MLFEWDAQKNAQNISNHGIDFEAAKLIFDGPVLEFPDERFQYDEERVIAIGVLDGHEIVVVYADRGPVRRIISARRATSHEREAYYQAFAEVHGAGLERLGPRRGAHRQRNRKRH